MKCLYAREMRLADSKAIDLGIPALILMENAGRAVYESIRRRWPRSSMDRVIVFAGKGNNGGDGFVAARHLWNNGYDVRVFLMGRTSDVQGHALVNLEGLIGMGVPLNVILDENDLEIIRQELASYRGYVCVDAIFGTGLSKEVGGLHRQVIECLNDSPMPVIAVDIPSGLCSDTGFPLGIAVRADTTVTFAYPKVGCVLSSGIPYVGNLEVADISIPKVVEQNDWMVTLLDNAILGDMPVRAPEAHKGDFGRVLILAGSSGFTGAAALASSAVLRSGAGLATLGIPAGLNPIMEVKLTEVMTRPLGEANSRCFDACMADEALHLSENSDALVMGPGMSTSEQTSAFVMDVITRCTCPVVLDADALNIIACSPLKLGMPAIMTPHPGEMSRLLGIPIGEIERDRVAMAKQCALKYNAAVILKGHRSIIASPDGYVAVNTTGSNSMASGGMGDILAGILGALLAQGLPPFQAGCLGAYLHGLASDKVGSVMARGQIASDLLEMIPRILKENRDAGFYH